MKPIQYLVFSLACIIIGAIFFAYYVEWIIVRIPIINTEQFHSSPQQICKKKVALHYWHNEAWHHEETELIWSDDLAKTIELLINSWLSLLDEEEIIEKRITVQSVALCPRQQEAYLYFDRYPFNKEESTFEKCIFLEGLLKTIRHNDIKIQLVRFLVHHEPMQDYHLDFSNSWPIAGFLESTAKGSNIIT